ncbi:DUF5107 domain-containing protein [Parapedobacter sp. 10938]|uniref:DUF5107 domain-containing protein n=1 Tax=Parapedobacter flavus TaxID=3110225 RepID=UPI002DB7AB05|nr:DUF5107 domain-containing protein [Parapedobacter sp. 10938]MEC3878526.1 DUF5107 domain-containing protein [Parapedobacter sp. 10938]
MKENNNILVAQRMEHGLDILTIENDCLRVDVIPALGGKISSIYSKQLDKEFLWNNAELSLQKNQTGDDYDSNFWGGIDELLPNDIPERIDGIDYPDHGELWTTRLDYSVSGDDVSVYGVLPLSRLYYKKTIRLSIDAPKVTLQYNMVNQSAERRRFLWKLHAALRISEGDQLLSPATKAKVVSPGASRFAEAGEFTWPVMDGIDASIVPEKNNTMDFFYLYDSPEGTMSLIVDKGRSRFSYHYDQAIFPYQWYFASYGKFRNHYTAILEPASAMPVSVNEAADLKQCSVLEPGETFDTQVVIYAGSNQ